MLRHRKDSIKADWVDNGRSNNNSNNNSNNVTGNLYGTHSTDHKILLGTNKSHSNWTQDLLYIHYR